MDAPQRRIAVFPGSFDPITVGHVDLVRRALPLFDEIVVAIGTNSQKSSLFPLDKRLEWLHKVFATFEKVRVDHFEGLTVQYLDKIHANYLLRGLRSASDFDYEKTISQINRMIGHEVETVFLIAHPEYSHISSTIVREVVKGGGPLTGLVPPEINL